MVTSLARLGTRIALMFSLVLFPGLVGCGDKDPTGPSGTLITSGTPVTNISGAEDSQKVYRIAVPAGAGQLSVVTSGGTGDADIYVRRGQPPTALSVDDCVSDDISNEESCVIASPASGDWYIMIVGFEAYSGLTLTATVTQS